MPKRPSTPKDPNLLAKSIFDQFLEKADPTAKKVEPKKNPHAVALGKLGGSKGGKMRATNLSARKRKEIAIQAARVRWGKSKS